MNKKLMPLFAIIITLFLTPQNIDAAPTMDQTGNLIANGNFESGLIAPDEVSMLRGPGSSAFTSWSQRGNGIEPLSYTQLVTDPLIEGNYTAHIWGGRASGIFQYPGFSGDTTVSAWVYVVSGSMILGTHIADYEVSYTGKWEYVKATVSGGWSGPYIYTWGPEDTSFAEFYVDCVWINEGLESTSPCDPSTGFDPNPPIADFSANPTTGTVPLTVSFTDNSSGTITAWSWDFDDDGTQDSALQNPSYTYNTVGTYSVSLTVTGPGGTDTGTRTGYVLVDGGNAVNVPPISNAGPNQTVDERSIVALDGSKSSDSDGIVASYEWTQTSGPSVTISNAITAQPTFMAPEVELYGTALTFELKVTDNEGLQSTDTCTVTIENIDIEPTCTSQPSKPQLLSPTDGILDVSLSPPLMSSSFVDPSWCSTHWKTRWQISKQNDFSGLTLNANTINRDLTSYQVDHLILEPSTTYYWRIRYWGTNGNKSEWSNVFSFTTQADSIDGNNNGIPDNQEVDDSEDLNEDGTLDNDQTNVLKSLKTVKGNSKSCVYPQDSQISFAEAVDDNSVQDLYGKPSDFPRGLLAFRLTVPYQGYRARVKIHLCDPAPNNAKWVRYDEVTGWQDYSDHASFNGARDEVIVELKDGGYGDSDHAANGIIVDPSGLGTYKASTSIGTGGGGGGCFISTLW